MKRIIIAALLVFAVNLSADDMYRLSIRGSIGSFWNGGWLDKFYFHTFSYEDLLSGHLDFNRTPRYDLYPNPEIWYTIPISPRTSISLCFRYEKLKLHLYDGIHYSWRIYDKWLKADLNFYSIGARLQYYDFRGINPYLGFNTGYCYGNLRTIHDFELPDVYTASANVFGDGGGLFYDLVAGFDIPLGARIDLFFEGDFRFTPGWKRFEPDEIQSEGLDYRTDWLIAEDRRLDRFVGGIMRLGLALGIL